MQTGSDGIQACASCHFHAGTDNRTQNQLSPAANGVDINWNPSPDYTFSAGFGPNYQLTAQDFPFHKLQDPNNKLSVVLSDRNSIVSSQGIHKAEFVDVVEGSAVDTVDVVPDSVFQVDGINVRQAPSRSTPSVINAIFNNRQFWDGRGQNIFNGVNGWGDRDPNARVLRASKPDKLDWAVVRLNNSSLASQAVGPPTNELETSAGGRMFVDLATKLTPHDKKDRDSGKKLKNLRPLARQLVTKDDSVLGPYSAFPNFGLQGPDADSYTKLIQKAFKEEWWNSTRRVVFGPGNTVLFVSEKDAARYSQSYTMLEYNFALFFGLAVQMYEATLVSDDTPFDRYMEGQTNALTPQQIQGLQLFSNTTSVRCINCHGGAELTNASVTSAGPKAVFRRSGNLLDTGFNNLGLRPTREDLGVGGVDIFGNPLSNARTFKTSVPTTYDPAVWGTLGVDGAFKTPGLRNVELTGPYFHTGSVATLRQVVDFYSRGGDFQPVESRDGEIFGLHVLNLSDGDKEAIVAFLRGLTDERVRYQKAPFDHPMLIIPNGEFGNTTKVYNDGSGRAIDQFRIIPPVGKNGWLLPLERFLE